jgi:hypothetical protein
LAPKQVRWLDLSPKYTILLTTDVEKLGY